MAFNLTSDICEIILKNIYKPKYELLEWIDINKLDYGVLSANPKSINFISKDINKNLLRID